MHYDACNPETKGTLNLNAGWPAKSKVRFDYFGPLSGFPQKLFTNFQPVDPLNCSGRKTCITTKLLDIPKPFGVIRRLTASIEDRRYGRNFFFAASFSGR